MTERNCPRVSIGVPTFNRPADLERCLRELCGQTYSDLEIIVSDNASANPEVEKIGLAASLRDPRVRYVRQPDNIGPLMNFQFVLGEARGEYFMWAADDDSRAPRFVESLVRLLDETPDATFAFCRFEARNRDGRQVPQEVDCMEALRVMNDANCIRRQIRFFVAKEGGGKPHAIYGLIRRRALIGFSWPKFVEQVGWLGTDVLFIGKLLSRGRLALSNEPLMCITVDSIKHYEQKRHSSRMLQHFRNVGNLFRYSLRHIRVASPLAAVCIALLMPVKFGEILIAQGFVPLWRRIRRFNKRVSGEEAN